MNEPSQIGALGVEFGQQRNIGRIADDRDLAKVRKLAQQQRAFVRLGVERWLWPEADYKFARLGRPPCLELVEQGLIHQHGIESDFLAVRFFPGMAGAVGGGR